MANLTSLSQLWGILLAVLLEGSLQVMVESGDSTLYVIPSPNGRSLVVRSVSGGSHPEANDLFPAKPMLNY